MLQTDEFIIEIYKAFSLSFCNNMGPSKRGIVEKMTCFKSSVFYLAGFVP